MTDDRHSRLLGPMMSIAMVVGLIIGAGVFLLPASIAPFGINMFFGWALTIGGFLSLAGSQAISWALFFVPFQAGSAEGGAYAIFEAAGLSSAAAVVSELARKLRRLVFIALGVALLGLTAVRRPVPRAT